MDRICGLVTFILGVSILWQGRHSGMGSFREPGPGFFPNLVAILMMILSLFLIIPKRKGESFSTQFTIRVAIVFVVLVAYSFALEYLGFVIGSFFLMAYLFMAFSGSRRWYVAVLWALISVGLAYLLFGVLLEGNLPRGVFGV